ncbi:terminase small subunit [Roseibaca calidilacus]|uniref:Phage terminase small subunit n=2 Tax=Roseibaca calidilacus TaxID=1666912 RepID=A0ABM9VSC2_9RHOB|nr:terminase small subunit [Roseibaca calidilacus]CUX80744.1 phage terminase small subunit [Roseibaca calidilacus]
MRDTTHEYLLDLNATQAATRAGYSKRTAQAQSSRLLSNVMIKAEIARLRREAEIRTKVDLDRILEEYARFAFAGLSKFIRIDQQGQPILDLSRCGPEELDLLAELRVDGDGRIRRIKIKQLDKLKALEALGKHLGLGENAGNAPPLLPALAEHRPAPAAPDRPRSRS